MYLLDTDILGNLVRPSPSASLIAKLASVLAEQQFTSSITLGEMLYGAYRNTRHYGVVRAYLEQQGTVVGDADTRIASIALSRNLAVVTGNVRHFQRVPGLRVENWLE